MRPDIRWLLTIVLAGALVACGGTEQAPQPTGDSFGATAPEETTAGEAENSPPEISGLTLQPTEPKPGGTVQALFDVKDADGDPVRVTLRWRHNGRLVGEGDHRSLAIKGLTRGDRIEVEVVATDGRAEGGTATRTVRVGNRAPVMQGLNLSPEDPVRPGDVLEVSPEGVDADGDALEYGYRWFVNEREIDETGPGLDTSSLRRGDQVMVRVRVRDDRDQSPEAESRVVEIANSPPVFGPVGTFQMDGGVFRHTFEATDPDGDRSLRYRLGKGPRGMRVDGITGRTEWQPTAEQAGKHVIEIIVADSRGDASAIQIDLDVSAEVQPPASPTP
jgi:hypothetical protein